MAKPKKLQIETLPKIHLTDPHIGKAIKQIVDYINKNVTPVQGNRV